MVLLSAAVPGRAASFEELRIDLPRIGEDDMVDLEASFLTYDRASGRVEAEGEVVLGVRDLRLRSRFLVLDPDSGHASATGDVIVEYGARRLEAGRLWLELDGERAVVEQLALRIVDPRTGRLLLRLDADRLERPSRDLLLVDGFCYTACECPGEGPPSWSLSARRARIEPERGAWLFGASFRVLGFPILPLPAFYLPLGDRRSGLLAPRFGYSGKNGVRLALPLYLTLGPSWDMTLMAGFHGGVDSWTHDPSVRPGVRGPDQSLELRWAPTPRTRGILVATHLYDLNSDLADPSAHPRGSRLTLRANHTGRFDEGGFGAAGHGVHASVNLLSDAAFAGDLQPTIEQAQRGYVRSSIRGHLSASDRVSVELGARWLQDIRQRFIGSAGVDSRVRPLFGRDAPTTAQMLPMMYYGTPTSPVVGSLGFRTDGRLVSWQRPFGQEDGPSSMLHGRTRQEISHPIRFGDLLGGRAGIGLAADLWHLGGEGDVLGRAYPDLEIGLHTGISRRFEEISHRLRPGLRWRLVPVVIGDSPEGYLDVFERALDPEGLHQVHLSVANEIWAGGRRALLADISQGWDHKRGAPSDLEFDLSLSPPSAAHRLESKMGWDWEAKRLSFASATGRLAGGSGASLNARWLWVQPEASTRLLSGLDEIFFGGALPAPPLSTVGSSINEVVLGVALPRVRRLWLRYDVSVDISESPRSPQHRARIAYRSACRCWSGTLTAIWPPDQIVPELTVGLELAGLGSVATRRGGL